VKQKRVWFEHCTKFLTTQTTQNPQSELLEQPGNPDPRQPRAGFDNFPLAKEKTPKLVPKKLIEYDLRNK
jgi:hypothetical protein